MKQTRCVLFECFSFLFVEMTMISVGISMNVIYNKAIGSAFGFSPAYHHRKTPHDHTVRLHSAIYCNITLHHTVTKKLSLTF